MLQTEDVCPFLGPTSDQRAFARHNANIVFYAMAFCDMAFCESTFCGRLECIRPFVIRPSVIIPLETTIYIEIFRMFYVFCTERYAYIVWKPSFDFVVNVLIIYG